MLDNCANNIQNTIMHSFTGNIDLAKTVLNETYILMRRFSMWIIPAGIALALFVLLSLNPLNRMMPALEIFSGCCFASTLLQQTYVVSTVNLYLIGIPVENKAIVIQVSDIITKPIIIIWIVAFMSEKSIYISRRILVCAFLFGLLLSIDYVYSRTGVLPFIRWTIGHSMIMFLIVVLATYGYHRTLRHLARRWRAAR
jgi:hypothetical protein